MRAVQRLWMASGVAEAAMAALGSGGAWATPGEGVDVPDPGCPLPGTG